MTRWRSPRASTRPPPEPPSDGTELYRSQRSVDLAHVSGYRPRRLVPRLLKIYVANLIRALTQVLEEVFAPNEPVPNVVNVGYLTPRLVTQNWGVDSDRIHI